MIFPGGMVTRAAGITHRKGYLTMKVRAKWSIKDASGWHDAGEVFDTESDLGNAVEVLDAPKKPAPVKKAEPEPEPKAEPEPKSDPEEKPEADPVKEPAKPRSTTRRKASK